MITLIAALLVFIVGYLVNIFYITVLYHRGLAHGSVVLHPWTLKWVEWTGVWVTGIDPKAWTCMHRHHHMYSDTEKDPHSPVRFGVPGVALGQLRSYERTLRGLICKDPKYTRIVEDIPFPVNFLNRNGLWYIPYLLHFGIGVALACTLSFWVGLAYYVGITSHPVQGWMVNALAHKYGYRNFSISDRSTNNWLVSMLVFGEGYQNNHHARPKRANFAIASYEIDFGYYLCLIAKKFAILKHPSSSAAGK